MHSLTLLLALASTCILQCQGQLSPFEETLAAIRFVHLENDFQVFHFFRATSTTTERTVQETTGAAADEVEEELVELVTDWAEKDTQQIEAPDADGKSRGVNGHEEVGQGIEVVSGN